jgi:hypothetical protein
MKNVRLFLLVTFSACSLAVQAQWAPTPTNANDAYLTYTGKVGIGTQTPKTKLDLGNSGGSVLSINPGTTTVPSFANNVS